MTTKVTVTVQPTSIPVHVKINGVAQPDIAPGDSATFVEPERDGKISLSASVTVDAQVNVKNEADSADSVQVKASNAGTGTDLAPGQDQDFTVPMNARLNINRP